MKGIMLFCILFCIQWASYHTAVHVLTRTISMNLNWSESAWRLLSSCIRKITGDLWNPGGPDGQITITLHIYRSTHFDLIWFGDIVNGVMWFSSQTNFIENVIKIYQILVIIPLIEFEKFICTITSTTINGQQMNDLCMKHCLGLI